MDCNDVGMQVHGLGHEVVLIFFLTYLLFAQVYMLEMLNMEMWSLHVQVGSWG